MDTCHLANAAHFVLSNCCRMCRKCGRSCRCVVELVKVVVEFVAASVVQVFCRNNVVKTTVWRTAAHSVKIVKSCALLQPKQRRTKTIQPSCNKPQTQDHFFTKEVSVLAHLIETHLATQRKWNTTATSNFGHGGVGDSTTKCSRTRL